MGPTGKPPVLERLVTATNAHDLDALVACFAGDYVLTMPAHPAQDFVGADQVRRNWAGFFHGIFTVTDDLLSSCRFYVEPVDQSDRRP